jgi:hypothetical protein
VVTAPRMSPGNVVAVRGALGLAVVQCGMVGCPSSLTEQRCCNGCGIGVVVGDPSHAIKLDGLGCHGDESRLCCDVPAFGQSVVAAGTLSRTIHPDSSAGVTWSLGEVSLCTEQPEP